MVLVVIRKQKKQVSKQKHTVEKHSIEQQLRELESYIWLDSRKTNRCCRKYVLFCFFLPNLAYFALRQSGSPCCPTSNWYCFPVLRKKINQSHVGYSIISLGLASLHSHSQFIQQSFGVGVIPSGYDRKKLPNQEIMDSAGIFDISPPSSRPCKLIIL